jgi:hypothetical protein
MGGGRPPCPPPLPCPLPPGRTDLAGHELLDAPAAAGACAEESTLVSHATLHTTLHAPVIREYKALRQGKGGRAELGALRRRAGLHAVPARLAAAGSAQLPKPPHVSKRFGVPSV